MNTFSEYSAELQLQTLQLNPDKMMQPVLDIGCGENYYLVKHLRALGIEAYGLDRFLFSEPYLQTGSWLEYIFNEDYWGTIISHFAITNPSIPGTMENETEEIFTRILNSLKKAGSFHFTPEWLPFDGYVNMKQFTLNYVDVDDFDFKAVIIKKL